MRRSFVLLFMLLALFWQSVALARLGSTVNAVADMAHAALHLQAEGHHHHEDGSYQLDDSNESVQHVVGDHVGTTVALPVSFAHDFPPLGSSAAGGVHQAPVPGPDLEGLLRPPSAHA